MGVAADDQRRTQDDVIEPGSPQGLVGYRSGLWRHVRYCGQHCRGL